MEYNQFDCAILGNGPSLLTAEIPPIPTFGCNFIGKLYQPTYFVCVDKTVIAEYNDLIYPTAKAAELCFLRDFNSQDAHPAPLYDLPNARMIKRDTYKWAGESSVTGCTTTYMMLKIAFALGFGRVFLYGVDHTEKHFTEDWGPGTKPCLEARIKHYKIAAEVYRSIGGEIINRSAPSVLDTIFTR